MTMQGSILGHAVQRKEDPALITGGPAAFTIVLVEMVSVATLSLLVLFLCYRAFERAILSLQELIIRDNRTLGAFLCIMLIIPIVLLLVK